LEISINIFQPRNISKKNIKKDISDKVVKKLDNSFKEVWHSWEYFPKFLTMSLNPGDSDQMAEWCGQLYSQGQAGQHAQ
jgi:hypothetical protein